MHAREPGDTYIDDGLHYQMSVVHKVLVTEPMPRHAERGEWWWIGNVPRDVEIDEFYTSEQAKPSDHNNPAASFGATTA